MGVNLLQNSTSTVYAQSDANTGSLDNVSDFLGADDSTQYAGRIWTDKSVSEDDVSFDGVSGSQAVKNDDEDFLVTYSALATSQTVTGKANVPVDVVFVIDNSNSMDENIDRNQTRLEATVEAVNTSIKTIMDSNEESRVAVVVYGSSAYELLPLNHYSPMSNGDYIRVSGDFSGDNSSSTNFTASGRHTLSMTGRNRGTNIHMGVDSGMDILKTATNIGTGVTTHIPSLVLLSDGAATYSGGGDWWNPTNSNQGQGSETANYHALKVAMNAQYKCAI